MERRIWAVAAVCALLGACAPVEPAARGDDPAGSASVTPSPTPTEASTPTPEASASTEPAAPSPRAPAPPVRAATVTRVIDGDTIDVRIGNRSERVRLIGVDTPERGQRWSSEATALTRSRLLGRRVWLEYDVERRDRYGRLLAYVWRERPASRARSEVRAKMHEAILLLHGLAVVLTIPPNVAYSDHFIALQRQARSRDRGLWSAEASGECDPSYPDVCIPPPPPDLDCGDIEHRNFRVAGSDPHRFDGDGNGRGCEG